mmetsp:Transcript_31497/g.80299  ORF Transcript_31497/g.80299 Transcript_31497/m.80299 type:complete len:356 (+) Transcript_31497:85-1152(+)|eukprot:CAMPEP_0195099384 /NCGR_PEP_ID=MMETSP0448-20130528/58246_1 /TAXON_ID=66468 /ORGANISM="Heterocapsa triquestra, Strain CCMP 448" /LENGTH=355 /DNA_ID=CAMNT_0040134263 /DNA_START=82 /DNA_END=1149 /DNA_ORIENTATION=+
MADQRLGVALVGLGRSGQFHLTSVRSLPMAVRLAWVVDVDEERCKKEVAEFGCKWATTIDEALADPQVHIVVIASTTDTHFPFIMKALEARKSVFTEKPISHEVKECQDAVNLALKVDLPFVCGYQRRKDHHFIELHRQINEGVVGRLKVIKSCSRDNPLPPMEYLRTSGGIFQDMLIHDYDMQDWLSGGQAPVSVTSVGHAYNEEIAAMPDLDTVAVLCKYESGLITMTDTCRDAAYGYDQRVEAFGELGMLTARNELTSSVEVATAAGHQLPPAKFSFAQRYEVAYLRELTDFVALVKAGSNSRAHREEQEYMKRHPRIVKTAVAAELSWRLNRQVNLSEDLDALMKSCGMDH